MKGPYSSFDLATFLVNIKCKYCYRQWKKKSKIYRSQNVFIHINPNCKMQSYYGIFLLTCLVTLHISKPNYLIIWSLLQRCRVGYNLIQHPKSIHHFVMFLGLSLFENYIIWPYNFTCHCARAVSLWAIKSSK